MKNIIIIWAVLNILTISCFVGCGEKAPTITHVDPDSTSAVGGVEIYITGTGFKANPTPTVIIGNSTATNINVISKNSLEITVPKGVAGPADIIIQNANSEKSSIPYKNFSYYNDISVVSTDPDLKTISKQGLKKAPTQLSITFNQEIKPTSVIFNMITNGAVPIEGTTVADKSNPQRLIFKPKKPFKAGNYRLTISHAKRLNNYSQMTTDYIASFKIKGKNAQTKSNSGSQYIPGMLSMSDNGYAWKRSSDDEKLVLCRTLELYPGVFSAQWYYRALKSFYNTSDHETLNMTISEVASLMSMAPH